LAREAAITIVLAMLGAFVAMLALTFGVVDLYLWLGLRLCVQVILIGHDCQRDWAAPSSK